MLRTLVAAALVGVTGVGVVPPASAVPSNTGPFSVSGFDLTLSPVSQQNAVDMAEDYIDMSPFSQSGLIKQLVFEGFSEADATYAAGQLTVDWNAQAARMAKGYLEMTSFSKSGLLEQLQFEGFTPSQAAYGVSAAYR